jgi:hypothetical protein
VSALTLLAPAITRIFRIQEQGVILGELELHTSLGISDVDRDANGTLPENGQDNMSSFSPKH